MGKRKHISYLRDMVRYWKKKAKSSNSYTKTWAEGMYETFREKLEKEKNK